MHQVLPTTKDNFGLRAPAIYNIQHSFGKEYINHSGKTISSVIKLHISYNIQMQTENSRLAGDFHITSMAIPSDETKVIVKN